MSTPPFEQERRLVPRWRASRILLQQSEAKPLTYRPEQVDAAPLETRRAHAEWLQHPSIEHAADVVISSITDGDEALGFGPAEQLIREYRHVAPALVDLARRVRYGAIPEATSTGQRRTDTKWLDQEVQLIRVELRRLRQRVREYARDPFAWHDLALLYARVGESDAARHAGRVSVGLAPENRIVIRSMARLLLHLHEPEDALGVVRRSERTQTDPWLASVEISLSDMLGRTPRLAKRASSLLKSFEGRPEVIAELAASLGTFEALGGSPKLARSHFKTALRSPSENVVAQARWISQRVPTAVSFDGALLQKASAFEGRALHYYQAGEWDNALTQVDSWLDDESFSSRPAVLGSFIAASILADSKRAEEIARKGLVANPHEPMLINNLAYALAYGKEPRRAVVVVESFPTATTSFQRTFLAATHGLVKMKIGALEEGRLLYEEAIRLADEERQFSPGIFARLHFTIAELESSTPRFERVHELVEQAMTLLKKENVQPSVLRGLSERISKLVAQPTLALEGGARSELSSLLNSRDFVDK